MSGFHGLVVDVVAHSRYQANFVAKSAEKLIENGGDGGFTIGSCDSHKFQCFL